MRIVNAIFRLLNVLFFDVVVDAVIRRAATKNQKEFERADANSMNAWKHFPF